MLGWLNHKEMQGSDYHKNEDAEGVFGKFQKAPWSASEGSTKVLSPHPDGEYPPCDVSLSRTFVLGVFLYVCFMLP